MARKRYCLYLSRPLAHRLERVASQRQGSKSALLEEALRKSLEPEQVPGVEEGLARRLNELHKVVSAIEREVAVLALTVALHVRYFLTVTPPLPDDEQESARLIGRKRYDVFLAEIGRQIAEVRRHSSDVLATVVHSQPDLFATRDDELRKPRAATAGGAPAAPRPDAGEPDPLVRRGNGHG
jgi:predicted transcriptional regulator